GGRALDPRGARDRPRLHAVAAGCRCLRRTALASVEVPPAGPRADRPRPDGRRQHRGHQEATMSKLPTASRALAATALLAALSFPATALAWGDRGHTTVAHLARPMP